MFKKNQLRSLSTLFLIGMTFILPIFLASVLYFFGHDWLVQKTNRGSLLNPPLALNQFHFVEENGSEYPVQKLQEKWLMLYRLPKDCDKNCSHAMHHMRQVQKSLGKDFYRIKIVLITDDFKNNLSFLETNASSVETPKDNTVVLLSFKSDARSSQQTIGRDTLYIVDPLGNIILKYSENWAMRDLYKDLQRLFKTSQIG